MLILHHQFSFNRIHYDEQIKRFYFPDYSLFCRCLYDRQAQR